VSPFTLAAKAISRNDAQNTPGARLGNWKSAPEAPAQIPFIVFSAHDDPARPKANVISIMLPTPTIAMALPPLEKGRISAMRSG